MVEMYEKMFGSYVPENDIVPDVVEVARLLSREFASIVESDDSQAMSVTDEETEQDDNSGSDNEGSENEVEYAGFSCHRCHLVHDEIKECFFEKYRVVFLFSAKANNIEEQMVMRGVSTVGPLYILNGQDNRRNYSINILLYEYGAQPYFSTTSVLVHSIINDKEDLIERSRELLRLDRIREYGERPDILNVIEFPEVVEVYDISG